MASTSPIDFTQLKSASFSGDLVLPGDADYDAALVRFSRAAQANAGAVAYVKTPEDIISALRFATSNKIPLAVRGGGHSTGGSSSVEGGLVIDMSRHFATVRVDKEKKLGYVGGGAVWRQVDEEAIKYGLATVGGTVNHTGVAGLVLGGGIGWLSGKHGLAIDNLEAATVITASGEVLHASADANPDLYWAIRGGGNNFGVVTEFVLRLHEQRPTIYAGSVIFPPPLLLPLVTAMEAWFSEADPEKEAAQMVFTKGPNGQPVIVVVLFYNGEEAEGRKRFKPLFDLGPVVDTTATIPYEKMNSLLNAGLPFGPKYKLSGIFRLSLPAPTAQAIFESQVAVFAATPQITNMSVIWEYYPMQKIVSVKPDATAFRARTHASGAAIALRWDTDGSEGDKEVKEALRGFSTFAQGELDKTLEGGRPEDDTGYGNYEALNLEPNKSALLFGGNYDRLRKIKAKYDPDFVFNKWYPIVPAAAAVA